MNYKRETSKICDLPDSLIDAIKKEIAPYAIGLTSFKNNQTELSGSGTLVKIDDVYGILTAQHVTEKLKKSDKLGLVIMKDEHRYFIERQYLQIISLKKQSNKSLVPDLSFINLPNNLTGTLNAVNLFYNFSQKQRDVLKNPPDYENGLWVLCGFPEKLTKNVESKYKFDYSKLFCRMFGFGGIEKPYLYGNFDYFRFFAQPVEDIFKKLEDFGGVSGGGVWQVILTKKESGEFQFEKPILLGVAFYELSIKNNARYIKCHGYNSIHKMICEVIKQR